MKTFLLITFFLAPLLCQSQISENTRDGILIDSILKPPTEEEISKVMSEIRSLDLSPKDIIIHDSIILSNSNSLYILSHEVQGNIHFGAVVVPPTTNNKRLPIILFATGGDGIHKEFDISQDFNRPAIRYPHFLGPHLDTQFIVVIPSFRGQLLIANNKKYQSTGDLHDAFDGASTDALAFLNAVLQAFPQSDEDRISIYGGSRGGAVALLAAARDNRIKRAITVAAPTDMKMLYRLYPEQFGLLFFQDFFAGNLTEAEARKKFIASSPIHFVSELPLLQLHHDKNDPFVPVKFATSLHNKMTNTQKHSELYLYDEGIHGFWTDQNFWKRVEAFIQPITEQE